MHTPSFWPTVVVVWVVLRVVCVSVCVVLMYCGFGMRITTEDGHFVSDDGLDTLTGSKGSIQRRAVCWTWTTFGSCRGRTKLNL